MKLWKNYLRPAVTLMVICLLVGAALAAVNAATAPVIAANESASLNATYAAVLPEADGFEPLDCSIEGVTAVLRAKNGVGYVITAQSRGYGGQVPAAVAFSADCATIGREVRVIRGSSERNAFAETVDDDFALVVRYEDGTRETVFSGEVSVRGLEGYV